MSTMERRPTIVSREGCGFRKPEVAADLIRRDGAIGFQDREDRGVEIVPPRLGRDVALIHRQEAARRCR